MRRHHREVLAQCQCQRCLRARRVARLAGALQLEVKAAGKQSGKSLRRKRRRIGPTGHQMHADLAMPRARKRDQARGMRTCISFQPGQPHFGAVAMLVLQERPRQQRAQVEIAATVLHQQQQAVWIVALGLVGDPDIASQDRLDPAPARSLVEADRSKEVGAVGEGERSLPVRRSPGHCVVDADDAVDDRELRVQTKMDELLTAHAGILPPDIARDCG